MITEQAQERINEIEANFSEEWVAQFRGQLEKVRKLGATHLTTDFAQYSFFFRRKDGFHGGLIFHGIPDTGYQGGGSVQLNPSYGWAVHT